MGAIRTLIEIGHRVPQDVSVIGYDDTPLGATFIPPLSSVHQNWNEGGTTACAQGIGIVPRRTRALGNAAEPARAARDVTTRRR